MNKTFQKWIGGIAVGLGAGLGLLILHQFGLSVLVIPAVLILTGVALLKK